MSTHAVVLRCHCLPLVHDAYHHLAQSRQRWARKILIVPLDHGIEIALELDIRFARPRWIVLAGKASGYVLENLIIVEVRNGAYPILRQAPFVDGVSAGLIHVIGQYARLFP